MRRSANHISKDKTLFVPICQVRVHCALTVSYRAREGAIVFRGHEDKVDASYLPACYAQRKSTYTLIKMPYLVQGGPPSPHAQTQGVKNKRKKKRRGCLFFTLFQVQESQIRVWSSHGGLGRSHLHWGWGGGCTTPAPLERDGGYFWSKRKGW